VDILGKGGMATVYCGVDREACRAVAVKMLEGAACRSPSTHTRFHREARAIAKLTHPGFARLLDWGIDDGTPFMVMEMVTGESLARVLQRHARIEPRVALRLAIATCELLEHAHALGLVHRDIKPSNIMVQSITGAASEMRVKLIDFGIAKQTNESLSASSFAATNPMALTMAGTLLGTPPYTSPEQLRGEQVDVRTDIYAVGVLLFRMITGKAPFRERHSLATACRQLSSPPPAPSTLLPRVDPALEGVILRCMASRRDDRFSTATDLRGALGEVAKRQDATEAALPAIPMARSGLNQALIVTAATFAAFATSAWLLF
jgi:serine/threonine-protein kinase